jgi:hypothetical protein
MFYTSPNFESAQSKIESVNVPTQVQTADNSSNKTVESLMKVRNNANETKVAQNFGNPAFGNFRPFFNPRGYQIPRDQGLFRMYNRNNRYTNPQQYRMPNCRPVAYCYNQEANNSISENNSIALNTIKQITNPFNPTKKENLNLS